MSAAVRTVGGMSTALFPHHDWADADGLESPNPKLVRDAYFKKDPDAHSARLKACHQSLWSKKLPTGGVLNLQPDGLGLADQVSDEFLKSDAAMPVWERWGEVQGFLEATEILLKQAGRGSIHDVGWRLYDMGGMVLFPGHQVSRRWTINQAKGCSRFTIGDRLDLTLECVRLYYELLDARGGRVDDFPDGYYSINPLGAVLHRYRSFFKLFGSFEGYVDFWLLNDLVVEDGGGLRVDFLLPRDSSAPYDFTRERALPADAHEYFAYLEASDDFVARRNRRMAIDAHRPEGEVCPACLTDSGGPHSRGW